MSNKTNETNIGSSLWNSSPLTSTFSLYSSVKTPNFSNFLNNNFTSFLTAEQQKSYNEQQLKWLQFKNKMDLSLPGYNPYNLTTLQFPTTFTKGSSILQSTPVTGTSSSTTTNTTETKVKTNTGSTSLNPVFTGTSGSGTSGSGSVDYLSLGIEAGSKLTQAIPGKGGQITSLLFNTAGQVKNGIQSIQAASAAAKAGEVGPAAFKGGGWGAIAGAASDLASSFLPEKTEYSGDKGDITKTMDSVYDGISNAAMSFGPIGMLVGGIMKGGKLLGQVSNSLGGGTDAMTNTDAILGSAFFNLTPVGLINGFGGSKTSTITKDQDIFNTIGSSYVGSELSINDAVHKSGKKYGYFSQNARKKADELIAESRRQLSILSDIAEDTTNRRNIVGSMSAINGNRRALLLQGGYDQSVVRVGRFGMVLSDLQSSKKIINSYKEGGKSLDSFQEYLQTLPENQRDDSNFRVRDYWEFNGKPKNFKEAIKKGMFTQSDDGWHAYSVAENPKTGDIEFMKSSSHPSILKELDWYESDEASEFRNQYELLKSEPYFKYVKRNTQIFKEGGNLVVVNQLQEVDIESLLSEFKNDEVPEFKDGGNLTIFNLLLEVDIKNLSIKFIDNDIEELNFDTLLPEFKEGGKFNIIPEGALHARKHNMDVDGITHKGIPVISHSENGEIELHAEIEREEIILRLEVTKKLEELAKDGSDESAIEAGKLLVKEILYNTIDNTHNLI